MHHPLVVLPMAEQEEEDAEEEQQQVQAEEEEEEEETVKKKIPCTHRLFDQVSSQCLLHPQEVHHMVFNRRQVQEPGARVPPAMQEAEE